MLSTPVKEFTPFEAALPLLRLPPDDVVTLLKTRLIRDTEIIAVALLTLR